MSEAIQDRCSLGGKARAAALTAGRRSKIATSGAEARAAKLSPERRAEIARKASEAARVKRLQTIASKAAELPTSFLAATLPKSPKERLALGYCRNPCGRKRYFNHRTGKLSALWCAECHEKQSAYDRKSWGKRHGG